MNSRFNVWFVVSACVLASGARASGVDEIPLTGWAAPPFWADAGAVRADSGRAALGREALAPVPPALPFVAIAPCRVADTRGYGFSGAYGPPALPPSVQRDFPIAGQCGIPAGAKAVSFNFTVTNTAGPGFLVTWATGAAIPPTSTLSFAAGQTLSNAAVVSLGSGSISVAAGVNGADLIVDVNGYYGPGVVTSLVAPGPLSLTGDVALAAGPNISITPAGNTLTIGSTVAQGPTGPTGPAGPAGVAGATGPSGPAGITGTTGPSGPAGPAGVAGPTGPSGPAGVAGPAGATGPQGFAGATGATGATGPLGLTGAAGPTGPTGPAGAGIVKDANGNALGALVGFDFSLNNVTIYKSGYFVTVTVSGKFPVSQIWWTSASCGGTGYLNSGAGNVTDGKFYSIYTKAVIFSGQTNSFYTPSSPSVNATMGSIENAGSLDGESSCSAGGGANSGWLMNAFDPAATLGWTIISSTCGSPAIACKAVAGPLQLP